MNNPILTNIIKQTVCYDKNSYNEYEFTLGKLYRLKNPRYYSNNIKEITFYELESCYNIEINKLYYKDVKLVFVDLEKSAMIYIGYIDIKMFKTLDLPNKGYVNKTIPCFYTKNTFVFPEQIVANNPQIYFKNMS